MRFFNIGKLAYALQEHFKEGVVQNSWRCKELHERPDSHYLHHLNRPWNALCLPSSMVPAHWNEHLKAAFKFLNAILKFCSPVDPLTSERKLRPKTSDGRPTMEGLGPSGSSGSLAAPRGAWGSTPTSTMTVPRAPPRPLSAGPFHKPNLEPAWILSDSSLKPTDPAVPLIEAIKKELDKFPSNSSKSWKLFERMIVIHMPSEIVFIKYISILYTYYALCPRLI